jgi:hypothetical protein
MADATIEDGTIVIRVPVDALHQVLEGSWASGALDRRWKLTDAPTFARDLVRELNREEEDGSTRVHRMFDAAIEAAIDGGADGIEYQEQQDV